MSGGGGTRRPTLEARLSTGHCSQVIYFVHSHLAGRDSILATFDNSVLCCHKLEDACISHTRGSTCSLVLLN